MNDKQTEWALSDLRGADVIYSFKPGPEGYWLAKLKRWSAPVLLKPSDILGMFKSMILSQYTDRWAYKGYPRDQLTSRLKDLAKLGYLTEEEVIDQLTYITSLPQKPAPSD